MRRNGISLIETLIAVSASSLLMLLSIGVLHQAMRLSSKAKGRTDFHQSNMRLASQFREDVHQATKMAIAEDGSLILTLNASTSITYRMESNARSVVIREVKRSSDANYQQDAFRLLDTAKCEFKIKDNPDRVTLELNSKIPGEVELERVEMRVSATANRWPQVSSKLGATR